MDRRIPLDLYVVLSFKKIQLPSCDDLGVKAAFSSVVIMVFAVELQVDPLLFPLFVVALACTWSCRRACTDDHS